MKNMLKAMILKAKLEKEKQRLGYTFSVLAIGAATFTYQQEAQLSAAWFSSQGIISKETSYERILR